MTSDILSSIERSRTMAKIGARNTRPEMELRKLVYGLGFRYRLHGRGLPGKPDLVFSSRKKVIFVNGCFWHQHRGCKDATMPKSRVEFWTSKLHRNVERDREQMNALTSSGWDVLIVWECEVRKPNLRERILRFLE